MTQAQLDKMTKAEITAFENKYTVFDKRQSLEDYTTAIRDLIYLWRRISENRKSYTFDSVSKQVEVEAAQIKKLYDEEEPAVYAISDVDYCCG